MRPTRGCHRAVFYAALTTLIIHLTSVTQVQCFLGASIRPHVPKLSQWQQPAKMMRIPNVSLHSSFSSTNSITLSTEDLMSNFPTTFAVLALLVGAISVFAYSNLAYTPEIMEGASLMRLENREAEVSKLMEAVREHLSNGNDFEELRRPLETALQVDRLEEYLEKVHAQHQRVGVDASSDLCYGEADYALAQMIETELARREK